MIIVIIIIIFIVITMIFMTIVIVNYQTKRNNFYLQIIYSWKYTL